LAIRRANGDAFTRVASAGTGAAAAGTGVGRDRERRDGAIRRDAEDHVFGEEAHERTLHVKLRKYYALTPLFAFSMFLVVVANNLGVILGYARVGSQNADAKSSHEPLQRFAPQAR